jgi:hypothetical protein
MMRYSKLLVIGTVCLVTLGGCSTSDKPSAQNATTHAAADLGRASGAQPIKVDKFEILHSLEGDMLTASLDTDLPDFTDLMVSISRSYFEKNDTEEYSRDYFEEKSTVAQWRQPRQIKVSHDIFKASLQDQQKKTALAGIGGQLDRIDPNVAIAFTVPLVQSNPAFGEANSNLIGAATTAAGKGRLVRAEVKVAYPLDAKGNAAPQWANRNDLVVGTTYRLSRATPLMGQLNPVGFDAQMATIASRKIIPHNGLINIKEVGTKDGGRWYRVEARDAKGLAIGTGWVNVDALIGQEVQVLGKR